MGKLNYRIPNTNNFKEIYVKVTDTLPIGAVCQYGGSTAPSGYLMCNGQAVSRTTYADLFKAIGTSFGAGDGITTFNVPNFNGRVPVGLDGTQTEFDTIGETGGSKELQEHNHKKLYWGNLQTQAGLNSGGNLALKLSYEQGTSKNNDFITGTAGTGDSGNLQPYLVTNYIIKASKKVALDKGNVVDSLDGSDTDSAPSVRAVNEALEPNIIVGKLSSSIAITYTGNYQQMPVVQSQKIGSKLSINNGDVIIGNGINNIKVMASVQYTPAGNGGYFILEIAKIRNGALTRIGIAVGTVSIEDTISTHMNITDVQENDVIRIQYLSTGKGNISADSTGLYVEVVN